MKGILSVLRHLIKVKNIFLSLLHLHKTWYS